MENDNTKTDLAERVAWLEAQVAMLTVELRTRRIVIDDGEGRDRIMLGPPPA
jgi:hypothetical protein